MTFKKIPDNLTLGRASWTWKKIHAMRFDEDEANDVIQRFGNGERLYKKPYEGSTILCNSAGCWIYCLYDDHAPYKH